MSRQVNTWRSKQIVRWVKSCRDGFLGACLLCRSGHESATSFDHLVGTNQQRLARHSKNGLARPTRSNAHLPKALLTNPALAPSAAAMHHLSANSLRHGSVLFFIVSAPRIRSIRSIADTGRASARQATWPSGLTNTNFRSYRRSTVASAIDTTLSGTPRRLAACTSESTSGVSDPRRSKPKPRPNRSSSERPSLSQACGARDPGRAVGWYITGSSVGGGGRQGHRSASFHSSNRAERHHFPKS